MNDKGNTPAVLLNILTPASEIHPHMLQIKTSLSHQYTPKDSPIIMVYLHLISLQ